MADQTEDSSRAAKSFAGAQKRRAGETIPGTMRRIGPRHAVVTKAVTAEIVDVGSLRASLEKTNQALERARLVVSQLEGQRAQLETRIAQFEAAPVERLPDDPEPNVNEPDEDVSPADAQPAEPAPAASPRKTRKP